MKSLWQGWIQEIRGIFSGISFYNPVDDIGGREAGHKGDAFDLAPCASYYIRTDNLVRSPVATLDKDVGQQVLDYPERIVFVKNQDQIHTLQGRHQLGPCLLFKYGPLRPLDEAHRCIAVDGNYQDVAQFPGRREIAYMAGMEDVKAAVGEHNSLA